jgi:hypothetical protein
MVVLYMIPKKKTQAAGMTLARADQNNLTGL